jgi:hypothetical protein
MNSDDQSKLPRHLRGPFAALPFLLTPEIITRICNEICNSAVEQCVEEELADELLAEWFRQDGVVEDRDEVLAFIRDVTGRTKFFEELHEDENES